MTLLRVVAVLVIAVSLRASLEPADAEDEQTFADIWTRAEQGDAKSQFDLGNVYLSGMSVLPQDHGKAARWYRLAAEQGHADAQVLLGTLFDSGLGVPVDHGEAAGWYRRAAEQGHVDAQHSLGTAYILGRGVPQDFVSAHMLLSLVVVAGNEDVRELRDALAAVMTREQIAAAESRAREWHER